MIIEGERMKGSDDDFAKDYNEGMLRKDLMRKYNIGASRYRTLLKNLSREGKIVKRSSVNRGRIPFYRVTTYQYGYVYRYPNRGGSSSLCSKTLDGLKDKVVGAGLEWRGL